MFDTRYSLRQKPNTEIPIIKRQMLAKLDGSGAIWTDKTMKIPQFTQLFDRLNTFPFIYHNRWLSRGLCRCSTLGQNIPGK